MGPPSCPGPPRLAGAAGVYFSAVCQDHIGRNYPSIGPEWDDLMMSRYYMIDYKLPEVQLAISCPHTLKSVS